MRVSLVGSIGWPGSFQVAVRLLSPMASTMNGVQPCDFAASCVSQNSLVLIQPTTAASGTGAPPRPVLLLSHSVLLASSAITERTLSMGCGDRSFCPEGVPRYLDISGSNGPCDVGLLLICSTRE